MKYYLIILYFISFNFVQAQNKENVVALVYMNYIHSDLEMVSTDHLYLITNQNKTIYTTGQRTRRNNIKPDNVDVMVISPSLKADNIYINNNIKDTLYFKHAVVDNFLYVKEKTPKFIWLLANEYKEIQGKKLQKATTTFRGRTYTAWCDLENPISVGPWKFNNLPGLAYEITDDAKDYYNEWYLTQIDNDVTVNLDIYSLDKFKKLELKEYVNKSDELKEIATSISNTRTLDIPGLEEIGSATTKINHRIKAQEIKYEWER